MLKDRRGENKLNCRLIDNDLTCIRFYAMEHPNDFHKILWQIMSQEPKPILSEEEIHFEELAMGVMELVGEKYVVWLN